MFISGRDTDGASLLYILLWNQIPLHAMFQILTKPVVCNVGICISIALSVAFVRHIRYERNTKERHILQLRAKIQHFEGVVREWNKRSLVRLNETSFPLLLQRNRIEDQADLSVVQ